VIFIFLSYTQYLHNIEFYSQQFIFIVCKRVYKDFDKRKQIQRENETISSVRK